jgi:hypothetical protein
MTEPNTRTKDQIITEVTAAWADLNKRLDDYTEGQLSEPRDAVGWAAKDHLVHMAMWERSVTFLLQHKPRYEGLGIEKDLYDAGDEDAINDVISKQFASITATEAREKLRQVHEELVALVTSLSDADLNKPYNEFLPDEPDDTRLAVDVIYGNTVHHYPDHMNWIEALIKREQG